MRQLARSVATGSVRYVAGGVPRTLRMTIAAFGLAAAISVPAGAANIVTNGSFETGDFTSWVPLNNIGFSGVECPDPPAAPQGNCFGFLGPVGSHGSIAQGLNTLRGRFYTISFDFSPDSGLPSDFSVQWGGTTIYSVTNLPVGPPPAGRGTLGFLQPATAAITTLQFNFRDDPRFLGLDAVSAAIREPATVALLGIGLADRRLVAGAKQNNGKLSRGSGLAWQSWREVAAAPAGREICRDDRSTLGWNAS